MGNNPLEIATHLFEFTCEFREILNDQCRIISANSVRESTFDDWHVNWPLNICSSHFCPAFLATCKSKYYGIEIPMMPCVVIATCQVKTCARYTKVECPVQTHSTLYIRELKQRGRERQRERYKTIDLITEYNHFTWECNHLGTFSPSSLETERENLNSGVL